MLGAGDSHDCPSADELAAFVAGEVASTDGGSLDAHVDGCVECRRVISALAGEQYEEVAARVTAGERLGRFTLLRPLGEGAMGEVWAAHDPELDREVAIKLLRISSARLQREGRAMARVKSHPNVVTVYELGTDGRRAFCAMELVDGKTLRGWLVTPRSWREVIDVAVAVGRGLAAAHAAGLVHRDVKPENVLIARDGRTLVTDFGLAKLVEHERGRAVTASDDEPIDTAMTATGAIVGTPAYMAPEQLDGRDIDAQSDQFSYCVTIYEALFGERPFAATNVGELRAKIRQGPKKRSDTRGVPARVVRALERGLSEDPQARWPSLEALLDELAPASRRGWIYAAFAAAVLATTAIVVIATRPAAPSLVDARKAGERKIAEAWGPPQRERLRAGFIASKEPTAAERATAVAGVFDSYRSDWLAQREDAWIATHVRGEQSVELLEKRLDCLNRLADSMGEMVTLFAQPLPAEVKRAPDLAKRLEPLAICKNLSRLVAKSLAPSSKAGHDAALTLRQLEVLQLLGRHGEAVQRAEALVEQTGALDDPMLHARARYNLGVALHNAGKFERAAEVLRLAVQDAAAIRDHYMVASAWLRLVGLVGLELGKPEAAAELEPAARAAVAQAGDDPRQLAELSFTLGLVAYGRGDLQSARDHMRDARERRIKLHGPDHPFVASVEANLAAMLTGLGELDEATRVLDHARAAALKALGDKHPLVAQIELNRADVAAHRKDFTSAETSLRVALEIDLAVRGPVHPETIKKRDLLAQALREQGKLAEARAELEHARRDLAESPPTMPAKIALDVSLARLATVEKKYVEAEAAAQKAVDGYAKIDARVSTRAAALSVLAEAMAPRDPRTALEIYDQALRLAETQQSRDRSQDVETLEMVGKIALAAKRPAIALAWFDKLPDASAGLGDLRAKLERAKPRH
jgi:tetratricopeptide (TPR) repeat protein